MDVQYGWTGPSGRIGIEDMKRHIRRAIATGDHANVGNCHRPRPFHRSHARPHDRQRIVAQVQIWQKIEHGDDFWINQMAGRHGLSWEIISLADILLWQARPRHNGKGR